MATLRDTDGSAVRAAWQADTRACREYTDADDYYVVYRVAEPTAVRGADEVLLCRVERVYFDRGDDEPAYARHTLVARTGRVVATVTYSFLTSESDPDATDFSKATGLLQTQLTKAARAFTNRQSDQSPGPGGREFSLGPIWWWTTVTSRGDDPSRSDPSPTTAGAPSRRSRCRRPRRSRPGCGGGTRVRRPQGRSGRTWPSSS